MNIYSIEAGNFKLDGGAMFGVVPKVLWEKTNPADKDNRIDMASRCLLIEDGEKLTLVDCGMGNKQDDKFFSFYDRWGSYSLEDSLKKYGFHKNDITDVLLTHLHFDHCGGATERDPENLEKIIPTFVNAKIWTNENHWQWANYPNPREQASFRKDNLEPIQNSGQLNFIDFDDTYSIQNNFNFELYCVDGHTEKQMLPIIKYKNHTIVYVADLIPTIGHLPLVYIMGYDTRPLLTMQEKASFLEQAYAGNYLLFFEHDTEHQMCSLKKTEKGIRADEIFKINDL